MKNNDIEIINGYIASEDHESQVQTRYSSSMYSLTHVDGRCETLGMDIFGELHIEAVRLLRP